MNKYCIYPEEINMKDQPVNYQELEVTIHSKSDTQEELSFVSKLGRVFHQVVKSIIAVNELKIYSLKSKSGLAYWAIHNPLSGRRVFFDSEAEVRAWIDRHYRE